MLLRSLDITVNFKLAEHPWVKKQVDHYSQKLGNFMKSQGFLIFGIAFFLFVIVILLAAGRIFNKNERMTKIIKSFKDKLMWSSVLRTAIQGYLLAILLSFK